MTFSTVGENEMKHKMNTASALSCPCPECGEPIALSQAELVVGNPVRCLHCNAEALVEQEFDPKKGAHHWTLESPDDEPPTGPQ